MSNCTCHNHYENVATLIILEYGATINSVKFPYTGSMWCCCTPRLFDIRCTLTSRHISIQVLHLNPSFVCCRISIGLSTAIYQAQIISWRHFITVASTAWFTKAIWQSAVIDRASVLNGVKFQTLLQSVEVWHMQIKQKFVFLWLVFAVFLTALLNILLKLLKYTVITIKCLESPNANSLQIRASLHAEQNIAIFVSSSAYRRVSQCEMQIESWENEQSTSVCTYTFTPDAVTNLAYPACHAICAELLRM